MYNKKNGNFYCFGCGFKGNLFEFHQKKAMSKILLSYIYSHIDKSQMCGDPFTIVDSNMEYNPMLCDECWIPALLDRGKRIQCQNCGYECERMEPTEEGHAEFRTMVEKRFGTRLRPFTKSL
jgi:hypothetical protein